MVRQPIITAKTELLLQWKVGLTIQAHSSAKTDVNILILNECTVNIVPYLTPTTFNAKHLALCNRSQALDTVHPNLAPSWHMALGSSAQRRTINLYT